VLLGPLLGRRRDVAAMAASAVRHGPGRRFRLVRIVAKATVGSAVDLAHRDARQPRAIVSRGRRRLAIVAPRAPKNMACNAVLLSPRLAVKRHVLVTAHATLIGRGLAVQRTGMAPHAGHRNGLGNVRRMALRAHQQRPLDVITLVARVAGVRVDGAVLRQIHLGVHHGPCEAEPTVIRQRVALLACGFGVPSCRVPAVMGSMASGAIVRRGANAFRSEACCDSQAGDGRHASPKSEPGGHQADRPSPLSTARHLRTQRPRIRARSPRHAIDADPMAT
jgi:hypothetical protein